MAKNPGNVTGGVGSNWKLVFTIGSIVFALLVVLTFSTVFQIIDCRNYLLVKLIYPILFGAVGVLLGGQVTLKGNANILNVPWVGHVTGGIGAALLGYAIAAASAPECASRHALTLAVTNWPVWDARENPRYYTTVEYDQGVRVDLESITANSRYNYVFSFPDKPQIQLIFRVFKREGITNRYTALQNCTLTIEKGQPPADKNKVVYRLESDRKRLELHYDNGFFERLETPSNVRNDKDLSCLTSIATLRETGAKGERVSIVGPIYLTSQDNVLGYLGLSGQQDLLVTNERTPTEPSVLARVPEPELVPSSSLPVTKPNPSQADAHKAPPTAAPETAKTESPSSKPIATTGQSEASAAKCDLAENVRNSIDAFIAGNDLDLKTRQDIYRSWTGGGHCYVWQIISAGPTPIPSQARALRLLNYALKNVDVYWQITSSSRRDFHKDPSPLASREFQKIFELAQAEADEVRSEAAAIIRYYPVDSFEKLFRMNKEQFEGLPLKNKGRLAIAASFMYYNRITENLNGATATEKARIKSSIDEEFDRSQRWAVDSFFPGGSAKPFKAMLFYGRAAVERWALDDLQTRNFAAMLGVLRTTEEAYPLRYHHIAQAVAIVQAGDLRQEILERLKSIVDYPASTYLERNAILAAGSYDLYAGPGEKYTKLGERLEPRNGTRLLLRSGDWVFIHGGSRIGWLRRAPGS